jgi:hypothetical protein
MLVYQVTGGDIIQMEYVYKNYTLKALYELVAMVKDLYPEEK